MQLKITRSQRETGMMSKTAIFCIDARVQFTPQEKHSVTRYKLQNQIIYDSEATKAMLARSDASRGRGIEYSGEIGGILGSVASSAFSGAKSLAFAALAATKLSITIGSLERGQHVECKNLDELIGAEEAIMQACTTLKGYLDTAATFDGGDVLYDYATGSPEIVAMSATPEPMLIIEPKQTMLPSPMSERAEAEYWEAPQPIYSAAADTESFAETGFSYRAGLNVQNAFKKIKSGFFWLPVPLRIVIGLIIALYAYHWVTTPPSVPVIDPPRMIGD
jgi:hypothetical protein